MGVWVPHRWISGFSDSGCMIACLNMYGRAMLYLLTWQCHPFRITLRR